MTSRGHFRLPVLAVVCLGLLAAGPLAAARFKSLTVSVAGEVARDYERKRLPDGSFKPEQYVIANGGMFPSTTRDSSFDKRARTSRATGTGVPVVSPETWFAETHAKVGGAVVVVIAESSDPEQAAARPQAVASNNRVRRADTRCIVPDLGGQIGRNARPSVTSAPDHTGAVAPSLILPVTQFCR